MIEFGSILRKGYEKMIGTPIPDNWWEVAKLPPKYGGMGWRTGLHTYGAHYIMSLAKTADAVCSIVPSHNPELSAIRDAGRWLKDIAPPTISADEIVRSVRKSDDSHVGHPALDMKLSIAQQCDAWHWKKIKRTLSTHDLCHTLSYSGSTNWWVTCPPLAWKHWNMPSAEWTAAVRRRLFLDVIPSAQQCSFCKWQLCDTKGNHALMCKGGPSRIMRHNAIRDVLANAIEKAGFNIGLEHRGG